MIKNKLELTTNKYSLAHYLQNQPISYSRQHLVFIVLCIILWKRKPEEIGQCSDQAVDRTSKGSTLDSGRRILCFSKRPDGIWVSPILLFNRYRRVPQGHSWRIVKLTVHLHQLLRLRMSGTIGVGGGEEIGAAASTSESEGQQSGKQTECFK